jgi:hypothetical protein
MENHSIIISLFDQFDKILAGFWTILEIKQQMDIAHSCLQDHFVFILSHFELCGHLKFFLVWPFIDNISVHLILLVLLGSSFAEDIESTFSEGSAIKSWVCAPSFALICGRSRGVLHHFALIDRNPYISLVLILANNFLYAFIGQTVDLNTMERRINQIFLRFVKLYIRIIIVIFGSLQIFFNAHSSFELLLVYN